MIEETPTYNPIRLVRFKDLLLWDVKRLLRKSVLSNFPIVTLGTVITEQNNREKIFQRPNEDFKILGVNNKVGLFDAYMEKGRNINQPYKKVELGWLAYNPYRINVGSIGVKLPQHTYDYISPAYVVFSCERELNPEFLFLLFKTKTFNAIIRQNTVGAVRQSLLFDTLSALQIPLPPLSVQAKLVNQFYKMIDSSDRQMIKANRLEDEAKAFFYMQLGIQKNTAHGPTQKGKIFEVRFSNLLKWSPSQALKENSISFTNSRYERTVLKKLLKSFDGGKTPSTSRPDYWNGSTNWVSPKDFNGLEISSSEDKITDSAISNAGMKVFMPGVILGVFRSGILRHSFPVAITTIPVAINQDVKAMELNEDIIVRRFFLYFLYYLQGFVLEVCSQVGVTVESINTEEFLNLPVIVPPKQQQIQITNHIEKIQLQSNTLRSHAENIRAEALIIFEQAIFNNN